jgi:hypothetical protein
MRSGEKLPVVVLGGLVVAWLTSHPRLVDPNPAEDDGFIKAIKIQSSTSFGGEAKPSVLCRKIYGLLKNPTEYERDTS